MAKILVVDDEKLVCDLIKTELEKNGYEVDAITTAKEAVKAVTTYDYDLILLDLMMPRITGLEMLQMIREKRHDAMVIMITAHGSIESAVKSMKLGAFDYITKPFNTDELLLVVKKALEFYRTVAEVSFYRKERKSKYGVDAIIGKSSAIEEIKTLIKKIAAADVKVVLVEGESGVGKELIARAVHAEGKRSGKPFVAINCASVPENLLESELFGHEKGAFTDAKVSKPGLIEIANEGTLFLDEIGDMPVSLQAKMLRFLEGRTVRRLGGLADSDVDVQVIAVTNRNLKRRIAEGKFREDLFYRINVVPIIVPPLRERREDIVELASYFVDIYNSEFKKNIKGFAPIPLKMIMQYDWPGNVRELRNIIERAMIFEDQDQIMVERLPAEIIAMSSRTTLSSIDIKVPNNGLDIEEVEKELVKQALTLAGNNQSKAARLLSIGVDAMRYKMKKFGFLK